MGDRSAHSHHLRWLDEDLIIIATPEGRMGHHQPLPATDLPKADQEAPLTNGTMVHPFGLTSMGAIYQSAIRHSFTNQIERNVESDLPKADQILPPVNMAFI